MSMFTPRETEVMRLVAAGYSNKTIGDKLSITYNTVKFHVANLLVKLGVDGRAGVAAEAVRRGLA